MTVRCRTLLAACAVALTLSQSPAWADRDHGHGGGDNNEGLTPDQAAAVVKRAYDGRVVSVKQEGNSYKVRVLLDGGRVKTVLVDSRGNVRETN